MKQLSVAADDLERYVRQQEGSFSLRHLAVCFHAAAKVDRDWGSLGSRCSMSIDWSILFLKNLH